jgi:cyanobactin maturation PatA/PatG family protease
MSQALRRTTRGDPRVCLAVLDGPVDLSHRSLAGAQLSVIETLVSTSADDGPAARHGTHVASIIFGRGELDGIAPDCRGLIVPIFGTGPDGELAMCSQIDLARAILQAIEAGANIINISGGQFTPTGNSDPLLEAAVRRCHERDVLVVAAAGNDGCACLHIPAALNSVLSVGAMDESGSPLPSSNWGSLYREQGILAPGKDIPGAIPGGGIGTKSGTSFATAVASGTAALLLSMQVARGGRPDARAVREALLASAAPCDASTPDHARCLAGRLNPEGALSFLKQGGWVMSDIDLGSGSIGASILPAEANADDRIALPESIGMFAASSVESGLAAGGVRPSELPPSLTDRAPAPGITPSDCGCGCGCGGDSKGDCSCGQKQGKTQLIYALGTIGYDFGTEARRDSFAQAMPAGANPYDPLQLAAYLAENPYEAESLIWTLNLDATPIYALVPVGPFAAVTYDRLRRAFQGQLQEGVEIVSIPGTIGGKARLLSGQIVPVVIPAVRGIFSWATQQIVRSIIGEPPEKKADREHYERRVAGLGNFLNRVYYDLRNLGITPEQRALNFAATNAFQASQVLESAANGTLELDVVSVHKSPVCRPDSDCYDIEIAFFDPTNVLVANRIYRFTVDVSDLMPVTIGAIRAWSRRPGASTLAQGV